MRIVGGDDQLVLVQRAVAGRAGQSGRVLDLLPAILPDA